ncbi:MAG: 2-oxoacid:ferredoxin oxidoreductase subunit beta [Myxococcales bacterium]|nr:2-oxoacid:ferredoxin oxidoreductase subunit beta [Myxococcales bacterium]MCB9519951.1 2-oxoacid:ferredoxin oxidoreductase subunit beta [Myxococcales bacterium]MCB9533141.1 2-oxoacid:ferredoxin oxidoreductase subunit beta [Myxococcales bacterium]
MNEPTQKLSRKDFQTDQDVRWCPGCGDYSILAALQKILPELGRKKEDIAVISGIGCSSRMPYYVDTYGFHTIHGRAFAVATGLKAANPDLTVFVITGDGDSMSIGGNHLIHALRRNVDLNIILLNNQIYGLTKGQYSPTSEHGKQTKSTPFGSIDRPLRPVQLALGARATFIARTADRDPKHMADMMLRAAAHKGTSFLEIYQNCNIFNDGAFDSLTDKASRDDARLLLEPGQPLVFGANGEKAIISTGFGLEVVARDSVDDSQILRHREDGPSAYHHALGELFEPTPFGVVRAIDEPTYEGELVAQIEQQLATRGPGDLDKLLVGRDSWEVA